MNPNLEEITYLSQADDHLDGEEKHDKLKWDYGKLSKDLQTEVSVVFCLPFVSWCHFRHDCLLFHYLRASFLSSVRTLQRT